MPALGITLLKDTLVSIRLIMDSDHQMNEFEYSIPMLLPDSGTVSRQT